MSTGEQFLKIKTCTLKVNIHCEGCKRKVKKILQKIDGVYTTQIDGETGKVTVSGNVDPETLIKKLGKNGKRAELWGAPKPNQSQVNNPFKNLQIDGGNKGGNNGNKGGGGGGQVAVVQKGGGGNNGLSKMGGQLPQQLQQMKGFQDLKLPAQLMGGMKMAPAPAPAPAVGKAQKNVKFNLPAQDDGLTDDEYDDEFDDDEFDDEEFDDEYDDDFEDEVDEVAPPANRMNPVVGNGGGHGGAAQMPNFMHNVMNGQHIMKGGNGGGGGGNGGEPNGGNAKKAGSGGGGMPNFPVQMNVGGGNGGKKGSSGPVAPAPQNGGGKGGKNGGGQPQNSGGNVSQMKNVLPGGGGGAVGNMSNFMAASGGMKGGGNGMNDGFHGMPNMMPMNAAAGNVGQMGNMPMGPMGLPPANIPGGNRGSDFTPNIGGMYYEGMKPMGAGAGPNPNYQQQLAAMMMHQQQANGNERFQPMMYNRLPSAVSYLPPYQQAAIQAQNPHGDRSADQYALFSDENTSSCVVM